MPLERFLHVEAASGILLLITAAVALVWANSGWTASYNALWHTPLGVRIGEFRFERSLEWFVNDVLMVIFFFVVGMEIRRELHCGELSKWRRAALPAVAALGGMVAPAGVYLALATSPETRSGWGIPMATDIAFAVGILTLLGKRVPASLRVLLLALAVIDDLGAIIVIAVFYSAGLSVSAFALAALGMGAIIILQRLGVRSKSAYIPPGIAIWTGIYAAGIHPTVAGVIIGLMTPVRAWLGASGFVQGVENELHRLQDSSVRANSNELVGTLRNVDAARREALSPAEALIQLLHPWVAFGIMPIFALANAGVTISTDSLDASAWQILSAVSLGLIIGKPLGVFIASWLALRLRLATLPAGVTLRHLTVLGTVAGVGFTMSLFIAQLAFTDAPSLAAAKLGVLAASAAATIIGLALGAILLNKSTSSHIAQTADEAERSTEL